MKCSHILSIACAALFLTFSVNVEAQTIADNLNSRGTVSVFQPDALNARLRAPFSSPDASANSDAASELTVPKFRTGYRVQVFDDNNVRTAKADAQSRKNQIESRFPEFQAYVSFSSPYWRVKVGDFRTRGEAEAAMAEIKQAFPSMAKSLRIVRDRINQR